MSNENWKSTYDKDGIVSLKVPPSILNLQKAFFLECADWLRYWGANDCKGLELSVESLPKDFVAIAKKNRALLGTLYKISRRFPSAKQLACDPIFVEWAKIAMGTTSVSCCNFVCARFDLPVEAKFLLDVHQDFPYIQGSLDGITIWMPFNNLSLDMGVPSWVVGSQSWGTLPVKEFGLDEVGGSGGKSFAIADPARFASEKFIRSPINNDTALLFHTLLLHRSEPNTSDTARITIQLRFDNFLNETSHKKGYPEGLYLNDKLKSTYPEFIQP